MDTQPFPFQTTIKVRFRDLDAMGHVNNAVYFTYMEIARSEFFAHFFDIDEPLDFPIILGEASCRYLSPAQYGETVRVGLGVSRFGTKSFDIVYRMGGEDGRLVATGRTAIVMFDYREGNSFPVPDSFKAQVRAFQGAWHVEM